jgi:carboxypeptidase Q
MKLRIIALALAALPAAAFAQGPAQPQAAQAAQVPQAPMSPGALRDAALQWDTVAWYILEGLTTEIGQRQAGTEAEERARTWLVEKLRGLGFSNVHVEPFTMPVWTRGAESVEVLAPFPQRLTVVGLGNSGSTPPGGITGEVVGYDSFEAFQAAPAEDVRGKIVFVSHAMQPNQDGSGYGIFGAARRQGPTLASRRGAIAILVRSIGTDHHRNGHTGVQSFAEGVRPIPAGALTVPDAEQLQRILAHANGAPVRLRVVLESRITANRQSGNVVAEVPGTDPSAGIVTIGGHLDSWDQGTGAIDNAAGVAITTAAAHRIMQAGRPRRTIRIVAFGAEEPGGLGGQAHYDQNHARDNVVLVGESDFGADRVWRVQANLTDTNRPLRDRIIGALTPLGIVVGRDRANAGTDLGPWSSTGTAAVDLNQDGTRYFDYHHTPDDTLDKVDPAQLRQNVAAWTALLAVAANAPEAIERVPVPPAEARR